MKSKFSKFACGFCNLYFKSIHRLEIKGHKNIPDAGPIVVMANHISYLDPPALGCLFEEQVYFMAKKELFDVPVMGNIILKLGAFPVNRKKSAVGAFKKAYSLLNDGEILGIFPEGTRRKKEDKLGRAKAGAVVIPIKKEVPILPVGIKFKKRGKLKISIGKSFNLNSFYGRKLSRQEIREAGEIIMSNIKNQLDLI